MRDWRWMAMVGNLGGSERRRLLAGWQFRRVAFRGWGGGDERHSTPAAFISQLRLDPSRRRRAS